MVFILWLVPVTSPEYMPDFRKKTNSKLELEMLILKLQETVEK